MSESIRSAVEALFLALDVPPPPGPHGERAEFTVDDIDIILSLAPDGRTTLMEGSLGTLSAEPLSAGAQLHRLLRGGLALAGENRAALTLPEAQSLDDILSLGAAAGTAGKALRIAAVARISEGDRQDAMRALEDIVQWRRLARDTLGDAQDGGDTRPDEPLNAIDPSDFLIIQP
jgi:hypothetical protein